MEKIPLPVRKVRRSLGKRLTVLIVFMILAISGVMMIVGYSRFKSSIELYYIETGESLANIAVQFIDGDAVDGYLDTRVTDEAYDATLRSLRAIKTDSRVLYLYVYQPREDGSYFIFDTDEGEGHYDLGYADRYDPNYPEYKEQVLSGADVDPVIGQTDYGWIITVSEPFYSSDGSVKGYVGIDFSMERVVSERMAYLAYLAVIILIVTVVFVIFYIYIIRRTIVRPINIMATAADSLIVGKLDGADINKSAISSMDINTRDELQSLSESLKSMERKINEYLINLNVVTIKSETDALTKLLNREAFEQQVSSYLSIQPDVPYTDALMMVDVDNFKSVNDIYGHATGDTVLRECADVIRGLIRDSDLAGRQGGDEFIIFCKSVGSASVAESKANQIRETLRNALTLGDERHVTISIGIAFAPGDGTTFPALFAKADAALYKAKADGRDRCVIYSGGITDV
jgi:diguanylate cyclase (GGDEF)-like protein